MKRVLFFDGCEIFGDDLGSQDGEPQQGPLFSMQDAFEEEVQVRTAHLSATRGVAEGLTLTGGINKITVAVGQAYDSLGRRLVLASPYDVPIISTDTGKYLVMERYRADSFETVAYSRTFFKRSEDGILFLTTDKPSESQVRLAYIIQANEGASPDFTTNATFRDVLKSRFSNPFATVAADGSGDFTTIQSAIDSLSVFGGGDVVIAPGTYSISSAINITQSNTRLIGAGPSTIVSVSSTGEHAIFVNNANGSDSLSGISILNMKLSFAASPVSAVALVRATGVRGLSISGLTLATVTATNTTGISVGDGVENSDITECFGDGLGVGISVTGATSRGVVVNGNSIQDCTIGISVSSAEKCRVSKNIVARGDGTGTGIYLLSRNSTVSGNTVVQTNYGIDCQYSAGYGKNNAIRGNAVIACNTNGIRLVASTTMNVVHGNTALDTVAGVGANILNSGTANVVSLKNVTS